MNTRLLKSFMALYGDTGGSLAAALGISPQRFSAKLHRRNGAEFTQGEIQFIKDRYNMTADQVDETFFAPKVS